MYLLLCLGSRLLWMFHQWIRTRSSRVSCQAPHQSMYLPLGLAITRSWPVLQSQLGAMTFHRMVKSTLPLVEVAPKVIARTQMLALPRHGARTYQLEAERTFHLALAKIVRQFQVLRVWQAQLDLPWPSLQVSLALSFKFNLQALSTRF